MSPAFVDSACVLTYLVHRIGEFVTALIVRRGTPSPLIQEAFDEKVIHLAAAPDPDCSSTKPDAVNHCGKAGPHRAFTQMVEVAPRGS